MTFEPHLRAKTFALPPIRPDAGFLNTNRYRLTLSLSM
jgi:hypothetical protein